MSRSSIFNFESMDGFKPSWPRGLLVAVTALLCLELSMRLIPEEYLVKFYSRLGFGVYMQKVILPQFKEPKIAFMGTSRSANAFMPTMIDESLGLPPFSTVNMGLFGSRTSDWEALYRDNRERLKSCNLVVLVVDEWSFNSCVGSDEHFALTASLEDRWNFVQPVETSGPPTEKTDEKEIKKEREKWLADKLDFMRAKRNRLLGDWAFNLRLKLGYVPLALVSVFDRSINRYPPFDSNHMIRTSDAESGKENVKVENYHERIHTFYRYFDTHPIYVRHIENLAKMIKEDGGKFVIVHLPNRRTYQGEVDKLHPAEYLQHVRNTTALAKKLKIPFYYFKYPEEIGLKDVDFEDYCHLAWTGTQRATRWFLDTVKKDKLIEK